MSSSEEPEERAPLVYSLHLENSCEDSLVHRNSSITNGANNILARWPTNLSQPSRAVAGIIGVVVIVVVTILIMYSFTTALVPAAFPIPRGVSKRSLHNCNDQGWGYGTSNYLLPSDMETKLISNERRIVFIKSHSENLTESNFCALKSAAREGRVVLMIALPATARDEMKFVGEIKEAGLDRVVDVVSVDPATYFNETPLGGFSEDDGSRRQRELKDFAFKVATVWRFAGAIYDLDLVTLKTFPKTTHWPTTSELSLGIEPETFSVTQSPDIKPRTMDESTEEGKPKTMTLETKFKSSKFKDHTKTLGEPFNVDLAVPTEPQSQIELRTWDHSDKMSVDANATVSEDGAILVAHQPCHAFVFTVMRELMEVNLQSENVTVATVVQRALISFCGEHSGGCNGVKVITKDKLCSKVADDDEHCAWVKVGADDGDFDWNKYCP